jgi:hypothetical protein
LHALRTGEPRNLPSAQDGLLATRIARLATEEAIRDRERTSQDHPSTLARAANVGASVMSSPLDSTELDEFSAVLDASLAEGAKR